MKYYILIVLVLACTKWLFQFSFDAKTNKKPLITLVIAIAHIVATIGYFNLMFTEIN